MEIQNKGTGVLGLMPLLRRNKLTPGKESSLVTSSYLQREFETASAIVSGKTFPLAVNKCYRNHENYKK